MDYDRKADILVAFAGLFLVGGILYEAFAAPVAVPSGYLAASGVTSCCGDCSCTSQEICLGCGRCVWTSRCLSPTESQTPGGLSLEYANRVADNSSFVLNAIVYPKSDGKMLVALELPRGFNADRDAVTVDLHAGEMKLVPFVIYVKEYVAEQDHTVGVDLLTPDLKTVSYAEGKVSVYWEH